jgi:hypothetical protein
MTANSAGTSYEDWQQYGDSKGGGGNPLIGMLIQKSGLEGLLNGAGLSASGGSLKKYSPEGSVPPVGLSSQAGVPPTPGQMDALTAANPAFMQPQVATATPISQSNVTTNPLALPSLNAASVDYTQQHPMGHAILEGL